MVEILKIIALGILQGVTEFLPVSSSGHLALAGYFFGVESQGASLEIFLHGGTLLSVLIFYRSKLWALLLGFFMLQRNSWLYAGWVLVSMLPAGIFYALGGDFVESVYDKPLAVAAMLCVTGVILLLTIAIEKRPERKRPFNWFDSLVMGVAQALALFPGVSRSGSTIAAGRLAGVEPAQAAEFSFIMSLPVIAGALLIDLTKGGLAGNGIPVVAYVAGAVAAAVTGCISIGALVRVVNRGKLWMFGVYCLAVGGLVFAMIFFGA